MSKIAWKPGFRSKATVKLAIEFAEVAMEDAECSLILFKRRKYAPSVYHFQQAVEKDAKAIGLLLGTILPTSRDLSKEASHLSLLGFLLRMPEFLEGLPVMQETVRKALNTPQIEALGISEFFKPILQKPGMDSEQARNAIEQIRKNRGGGAAIAWKVTLELGPQHETTKTVMRQLAEADEKCRQADEATALYKRIYRKYRKFLGKPPSALEYALSSSKAVSELLPLGIVSMWHERETRYPPVEPSDYWNPSAYTDEEGLIANLPLFHRHLFRLARSSLSCARAALQNLEDDPAMAQ